LIITDLISIAKKFLWDKCPTTKENPQARGQSFRVDVPSLRMTKWHTFMKLKKYPDQ
jgi:hypothetical protein